jgi:hypothetical protein
MAWAMDHRLSYSVRMSEIRFLGIEKAVVSAPAI